MLVSAFPKEVTVSKLRKPVWFSAYVDTEEDPGAEFPGDEGAEDVGEEHAGRDDDDAAGRQGAAVGGGAELAHVDGVHGALHTHAEPAEHAARVQHGHVLADGHHGPARDARHYGQQHRACTQQQEPYLILPLLSNTRSHLSFRWRRPAAPRGPPRPPGPRTRG